MLVFQRFFIKKMIFLGNNQHIKDPTDMDRPDEKCFDPQEAQGFLNENRYDDAVKMAETWLAQVPGDVEATSILCQGVLRLGKLDRLHELLKEVDSTIGRLSQVYRQLGTLCGKSGLNAESLKFFHKYNALTAALSPEESRLLPETTVNVSVEEADVEEKGEISPEFYTITLADLYTQQGHYAMAKEVLEVILAKKPDDVQVSRKLAELANLMTGGDGLLRGASTDAGAADSSSAILAELEKWLTRLSRLRSSTV